MIAKVTCIYKKKVVKWNSQTIDQYLCYIQYLKYLKKKVIFNQTYDYFTKQKLFYKSQYSFSKEYSTEYAALETIDRIMIEMDKN